ncbi:hypothetical protein [Paraburkholderia caribensis]|uniref:hypothetical protein n=1 Tax=Paraburkholderia caribensis TaxID=75105 RepID=UPI0034D2CA6F
MRTVQQQLAAQLADVSAWHAHRLDREIDYYDIDRDDEGTYGYCPECECNVTSVKRDFGIGPYEYWGSREVHRDLRDVCPTCEGDLHAPRESDEEEA